MAERAGCGIVSGLVGRDRNLRPDLSVTPNVGLRPWSGAARSAGTAVARCAGRRSRRRASRRPAPRRRRGVSAARARPRRAVHEPSQREPGEIEVGRALFRRPATISTPTNRPACSARARCSPHNVHAPTTSWPAGGVTDRRRAMPVQERLPGLGDLPDGAPRRARRALRGWAPTLAPGPGPSMLKEGLVAYHVADGPRRGPHARAGAPPVAGDAAGARAIGLGETCGTCARARRPTSCCCDRAPDRRWRPCSRTRRTGTPRSAPCSRWRVRRRCSKRAWAARSCSRAARRVARGGRGRERAGAGRVRSGKVRGRTRAGSARGEFASRGRGEAAGGVGGQNPRCGGKVTTGRHTRTK